MGNEFSIILVMGASILAFAVLVGAALLLLRSNPKGMSRTIAVMLFGIALEIIFATAAVPARFNIVAYTILKVTGRVIEIAAVTYFLFDSTRKDS